MKESWNQAKGVIDIKIKFTVKGVRGQGRPRFSKFSGAYKSKEDIEWEDKIRHEYYQAQDPWYDTTEKPIIVAITAFFPIPKSTPKYLAKELAKGDVAVLKKPDADNIIKSVLDALNGEAYKDDKQVISVTCIKVYTDNINDHEGYLNIVIDEFDSKTIEEIKNER